MTVGPRPFHASAVLRILAIAIAIACAIDPTVIVTGTMPARLAVVEQEPDAPASAQVRSQLVRDLGAAYEIVPEVTSDAAAAIVIGDRYPDSDSPVGFDRTVSFSRTVATVTMAAPKARIVHVNAPRDVPPATTMRLEVEVDGRRAAGQSVDLIARIAGVEIGRASHRWTGDRDRWRATLDVVPIGDAPFVVRIEAGASAADVVVPLRTRPLRVQVYDPRPSWASTFVRRALEADSRFQVESVSVSSRGVATRTSGAVPVTDPRLDTFDAVIVGGLERLSTTEVGALERYMRERGGAVALVPDQRVDGGPADDLVPDAIERLLERPATLVSPQAAASLQASEVLLPRNLPAGTDIVAVMPGTDPSRPSGSPRAESRGDAEPVVVSMARGSGRLFVSGAMDAWRFRAADERAFDRFWQAAIAGLALATPASLDVAVSPATLRPGEPADVLVRARGLETGVRLNASFDGGQPVRLWPDAEAGVYRGRVVAGMTPGRPTITVAASGKVQQTVSRVVTVRAGVRHPDPGILPLSMLSASHGGIDVAPDRVTDVVRFIRGTSPPTRSAILRHPMRSVWWIVPFAACLSGEWWLRRRRGLR